jgi:hypothetical protein
MPPQRRARERKGRALVAKIRRELKQELPDLRPRPLKKGRRRALTNERKYPFVVELAITGEELELALSRRIVDFHNRQHIRTRHGRIILRNGEKHYRCCFSEIATARAFAEQFGGAFYKP